MAKKSKGSKGKTIKLGRTIAKPPLFTSEKSKKETKKVETTKSTKK